MSMRISKRAIVLLTIGAFLVTACNRSSSDEVPAGDQIDCAVGTSEFTKSCIVEMGPGILTVHHPDGGFRRLVIDGQGAFSAADGADALASTKRPDGRIEVQIGKDRYILAETSPPATPR